MPDPIARLNAALKGCCRIESQLGEDGMATVCLLPDRFLWLLLPSLVWLVARANRELFGP